MKAKKVINIANSNDETDDDATTTSSRHSTNNSGMLYTFFSKVYSPFLMRPSVRLVVFLLFTGWTCFSISVIDKIEVGLDQRLSMPSDSYVINFFNDQMFKLRVGPPVYFVVSGNYSYDKKQPLIVTDKSAKQNSLGLQLKLAGANSSVSYIATNVANNWLGDYSRWANNDKCCRSKTDDNGTIHFCPPEG